MSAIPKTIFFKAGEVIFEEGQDAENVYLIVDGEVKITKSKGAQQITIATVGKNSIFGEMALIDNNPRSATVIAKEDTNCVILTAHSFAERLKTLDPTLQEAFRTLSAVVRDNTDDVSRAVFYNQASKGGERSLTTAADLKEIINEEEIKKHLEGIDPFIGGLFRVLLKNAVTIIQKKQKL